MFHVRVIAPAAEARRALLLEAAAGATNVVRHPACARLTDALGRRFEALGLDWHAEQTRALL